MPNVIGELIEKVKNHSALLGSSLDHNSMVLFVSEHNNIEQLINEVHETILGCQEAVAMSVRRNLAFLRVSGVGLEETPGLIGKISEPLRLHGINIYGILTNMSSILLFVNWEEREKVLGLIKSSLGLNGGE
jgi:aspartokinase